VKKEIIARYNGYCRRCLQDIVVGDKILYNPDTKSSFHIDCPEDPNSMLIILEGKERLAVGAVIEYDELYCTIQRTSPSHYLNAENVASFALTFNPGYYYNARVRLATDEESIELRTKKAEEMKKDAALNTLRGIAKEIQKAGEFPPGDHLLKEPKFHIGRFRAEKYFTVTEQWIWFVEETSDEWITTNVRGRGVGYRVPYTKELEDKITKNFRIAGFPLER